MTVNLAIFREMAQNLGFDKITHTIVVSGEEKTTDKGWLGCGSGIEQRPSFASHHAARTSRTGVT